MPTLVLVDGSSYLYRAFHALPDLRTSRGEPTGALRGVVAMLRRIVEDGKPDWFAVVFDAPGKTFRDAWYPDYKANRAAMPDELGKQIEPLHALIRAHGWPLVMVEGVEADDVIGTLARQAREAGVDVVISTSDKDLAQLVGPQVKLVNTMTNETLDEAGVLAKFGVPPERVLDLLTLTGDAIDNIPGVPKVGPKTAAKWLTEHGTLDKLIANAHRVGGVAGENLRNTLDWLPQGRRLLTVRCDCDLAMGYTDLALRPRDEAQLREMFERFEFRSWLRDLATGTGAANIGSVSAAAREPAAREARGAGMAGVQPGEAGSAAARASPAIEHETILDDAQWQRLRAAIAAADLVAFDVMASDADPLRAEAIGLAFAFGDRAAYVPLAHTYAGAPAQLERTRVLADIEAWLADPDRPKLGHNVKRLEHVLANHGLALAGVAHDTELESYVLESHKPHDLVALASRHLELMALAYDEVAGRGAKRIPFEQVGVERAAEYAAQAVHLALRLHEALYPRIAADAQLERVYGTIELPVRDVLFVMERTGVLIDAARLAAHGRELGERVHALEQQAFEAAGAPFNLGSPRQLCEILFDRMKLPVVKRTATGQPSTDEEVLQELAANYPLPRLILEHRALAKLRSTYTDKLPQMVNGSTGRVHTTFSQATAVTGRLASTEPNLQNIRVRTADGRRIREAFIAPPGHFIVSADYSQIELRIMAHLSGDEALLRAFGEGADIHRATAAEIFGVAPAEVTAQQRSYIKAVNFGLIYGMSAFGLASQLNIERSAAQQFIDKYFMRYPGVADYMQRTRELARAQGYVETVFGRRLWLPDIRAASGPRRAAAERAAIHAPMQGTAADLVKLEMIEVQRHLVRAELGTRLVLQVHDELVLEVPESEWPQVRELLPALMSRVATLRVPLVVDVGHGENWDQAH
jgi:DNA polymerase-1